MRRVLLATFAFVFTTTLGFAQAQPAPQAEPSPRVQPMFGKQPKTEAQQRQDEKFLSSCDKNFTNRQEASNFFMERGWEYLNSGQTDTAMYRFNLAWLLNPDNKDTYWAFGLVTASKGQQDEAIGLYEKALQYDPKNSMLLSDLGAAYLGVYKAKNKKKVLKKADEILSRSIATDTTNAYALYNLSQVKFYEKKYAESWQYLHQSRNINLTQIDYTFLSELMAKMPDPKGFFKATTPDAAQDTSAKNN
ncbi:tetratricopeptide repeat protein [Pontibacter liquoris]|uniref:tetratricopeptide repeat protein n=1 Tax=Pontibacter liquoris TaxID=2905677 RepID=UPI001FA6C4A6|nr:tetratricopeptide repeat protein [Pontibacter liquoris]